MKKVWYSIGAIALTTGILTFSSCSKDPTPDPVVEQEEFDHARIQFIRLNPDGSQTVDTTSVDFDKNGTPTPQQTTLDNGKSYRMLLTLSLKGESINQEIIDEGVEHKFFFNPSQAGLLSYVYNDADADGRGIGLDGKLTVTGTGVFDLKVILRHALDKSNAAAQDWNSTTYQAAGGEDDLNVTFGMKTQ
jgi:hypothetical protein